MPDFAHKVLWIVEMDEQAETRLLERAKACGAHAVCIRTTNAGLPQVIKRFHDSGLKVYAWRWPARRPTVGATPVHYFAPLEAQYVVDKLIPARLDGYIVDPESDGNGAANDWADASLANLATTFCATIKNAAAAAGLQSFRFGLTSGCAYPSPTGVPLIPWKAFVDQSDVLLPQTYWRSGTTAINHGTPSKAMARGIAAWTPISQNKPIVPMAGELASVTADEIAAFGVTAKAGGATEAHFHTDTAAVAPAVIEAIAKL